MKDPQYPGSAGMWKHRVQHNLLRAGCGGQREKTYGQAVVDVRSSSLLDGPSTQNQGSTVALPAKKNGLRHSGL